MADKNPVGYVPESLREQGFEYVRKLNGKDFRGLYNPQTGERIARRQYEEKYLKRETVGRTTSLAEKPVKHRTRYNTLVTKFIEAYKRDTGETLSRRQVQHDSYFQEIWEQLTTRGTSPEAWRVRDNALNWLDATKDEVPYSSTVD